MEESAVQQEKLEGSREGGPDGGKAGWKEECSLSSLLKHSCLFCWSSSRDAEVVDTDDRVLAKAAEIRELEHAVAVENLELQEQQSDRNELEETLTKLDDQKEKLVQQIKTTRQLCYEESQQILSLQAEEVQKESQVEEYERELARARWRLKKLREEVKQAKRKVAEAGERNTPLQDSIRQSYEEILQEEHTLCSLSGSAVTPESQLEESTSPADTTEDDPLPMRPWGRSQSLPAYADLILDANASSFCNNLAGTREEDDSGTSSTKMDRSDIDDDPEEEDLREERDREVDPEGPAFTPNPVDQLDFYQADPFAHVQSDHDLFNEDLFPKTDSSGGFASDPFKGSDPFAADMLFPGAGEGPGNADEADTSLSCAENKASTGTQCFESEFPDEDSDIEISYSREDLDAIAVADDPHAFKPIQSSSEELGPEPVQGWRSQGQYSVESDPNGYELDLGAISPPSDIEEHSLGSLGGEATIEATAQPQQGQSVGPAEPAPVVDEEPGNAGSMQAPDWASDSEDEARNPATPQNSLDVSVQPSFELNYEPGSQSSFDPYGFKLSPEHSSHTLLDPDEAELSPELPENELTFDPEPSSAQLEQLSFDHYDFDISSSPVVRDSDPYGFKLSPEEENQEVLDLCDNREEVEPSHCSNQELLEPHPFENQEVLEHDNQELLDVFNNGNQEVLEPSNLVNREHENQELLDIFGHDNQEVVEPFCDLSNEECFEPPDYDNQEVLEPYSNQEVLDLSCPENQEVLDLDSQGNQELVDLEGKENQEVVIAGSHDNQTTEHHITNENQELLDFSSHDNQEVLDTFSMEVLPETNNNNQQCSVQAQPVNWSSSSDSDVASEDLLGLELTNARISTATNLPAGQERRAPATAARQQVAEGDLGSVFGAGGYVSCPDVADDLEPMEPRRVAVPEPARPVRPPRPSLRAKEKSQAQSQGIDLK